MGCKTPAKTIQIGANAFAISGERTANGHLRFSVLDVDCALSEPDDAIALQFRDALKRRLKAVRQRRQSRSAVLGR